MYFDCLRKLISVFFNIMQVESMALEIIFLQLCPVQTLRFKPLFCPGTERRDRTSGTELLSFCDIQRHTNQSLFLSLHQVTKIVAKSSTFCLLSLIHGMADEKVASSFELTSCVKAAHGSNKSAKFFSIPQEITNILAQPIFSQMVFVQAKKH